MIPFQFEVPERDFKQLQQKYPNKGKNGDIGKLAVDIAILYFRSIYPNATIRHGKMGVDLVVEHNGGLMNYEIKGTESEGISYEKLRVSSKDSHAALVSGMKLVRVSNVRSRIVNLYFLEYGVHFVLVEEPRWRVKKL